MRTLLITGIDGFTGRYLASAAKAEGYRVVGLAHKSQSVVPDGADAVEVCDLLNPIVLRNAVSKIAPDVVAHLAAIAFVAHGSADDIYRTNILGTRNLLESLSEATKKPSMVLLVSSANIYGNSAGGRLSEDTKLDPANDYAVSKLAMEYLANLYEGKLPITIVRPFNYTGVGQSTKFLLPKIVDHVRRREPIIELGNLDVARDFSDVRMVVAYYLRLMTCPGAIGGIFNVCSGKAYALNDVISMIKKISGFDFEVRVNPSFIRENEVKVLLGDRHRLDSLVGEISPIALEDTLRWMLETP